MVGSEEEWRQIEVFMDSIVKKNEENEGDTLITSIFDSSSYLPPLNLG